MRTPNSEPQTPNSRIYLTGFMGSGKSTVGRLLAGRLGRRFLDLDDVIAEQAGRAALAIFAEEGEACFRRREAEALRQLSEQAGKAVIATGGGALASEKNLQRARRTGAVVYLRAPARVLAERLEHEAAVRPLLRGENGQTLAGAALTRRIERLLDERRRFYEQAHLTVDTTDTTPEETAAVVAEATRVDGPL